jgi:hypothetical protein
MKPSVPLSSSRWSTRPLLTALPQSTLSPVDRSLLQRRAAREGRVSRGIRPVSQRERGAPVTVRDVFHHFNARYGPDCQFSGRWLSGAFAATATVTLTYGLSDNRRDVRAQYTSRIVTGKRRDGVLRKITS